MPTYMCILDDSSLLAKVKSVYIKLVYNIMEAESDQFNLNLQQHFLLCNKRILIMSLSLLRLKCTWLVDRGSLYYISLCLVALWGIIWQLLAALSCISSIRTLLNILLCHNHSQCFMKYVQLWWYTDSWFKLSTPGNTLWLFWMFKCQKINAFLMNTLASPVRD